MTGLLRIAVIVGLGIIIGFALYLCAAALVLLHQIVPIEFLPAFAAVGIILVVVYDELGPQG